MLTGLAFSWLHTFPCHADPVLNSGSTTTAAAGAATTTAAPAGDSSSVSADTYIRCSCCQRSCHVTCLPAEQQQHLAAWAAAPPDSGGRDQNARSSRRIRSPRGQKKQQQAKQAASELEQQQQEEYQRLCRPVQPYFCSPGCKQTATELARQCARGVIQLEALADGTPVCWQLIQPAAVAAALAAAAAPAAQPDSSSTPATADAAAAPASVGEAREALAGAFAGAAPPVAPLPVSALLGTGVAPGYSQQQAEVLCQVLRDAQVLLSQQLGPVWEVRTYQQTLPWLLSGLRQPTPGGLLDLSHVHVAVLWVGSTLAAAALLRVHGGEGGVLEVTLAATSQQLQHRQLGRMLVGAVERFGMEACGVKQAWMPALGGVVKPCVGVSLLPGWEREDGVRGRMQLAPGCSLKLLGLDSSSGSSLGGTAAAGAAGRRRARQAAEDAAQKVPKGVAACWALKLSYGRAANVTDWLQLTTCPLLRYSYVPFVSKHLEPKTMLPVPQFKPQQLVMPPMLPPLPPQMQMQPHFAMHRQLPPPYPLQQRPLPMHPMMPLQPHQQHLFGPPHQQHQQQLVAPPPYQQQPQQPMLPLGSGSTGSAAAGVGGAEQLQGGMLGQQLSQQPEPPAAIFGAMGGDQGAAAAAAAAAAPAVNSTQEQQQEGKGADATSSAAAAQPQQQQEAQQGQQQLPQAQPSAPAQTAPSKRQQWKEQVMQQFLAQQRGAAAPVAAKDAQAEPGAADPAADDSNKAPAGDVDMQDAAT